MPSLSVRCEGAAEETSFVVLDALLSDEIVDATMRLRIGAAQDFVAMTREQWEAEGLEAAGAGPWDASACPWFEPDLGLDWCRRLRDDIVSHDERYTAWPGQAGDLLTELDAMAALLLEAKDAQRGWNLIAF